MPSENWAKSHCCEAMAHAVDPKCEQHPDPRDCEDALVHYAPRFDSYALLARFGAPWVSQIAFCPWCGDAKRDLSDTWFDRLEGLGIDPDASDLPAKFQDATWWRKEGL